MKNAAMLSLMRPHFSAALKEDVPSSDITSRACVGPRKLCRARVVAKREMVVCGGDVFAEVMRLAGRGIKVRTVTKDGGRALKGDVILEVSGNARAVLRGERTALNYLQRLSGIATLTARFVHETRGTKARILDTRKTTPGMRLLEKYAVRCGGGHNHRMGLSDAPLIKENHIRSAGGIPRAVAQVKRLGKKPVILEVTNRAEALMGLAAGADILLLDNMTPARVKRMAGLIGTRALVEVSGGVSPGNARAFALAGADRISVGALTHSAPAADISLLFDE